MPFSEKTGLWLIGGRGSVATTTIAGAGALRAGLVQPTGLVTENVIPLDPSCVRGTHGRLPDDPADGPVLLASDAAAKRERLEAVEVKGLLLELLGVTKPVAAG